MLRAEPFWCATLCHVMSLLRGGLPIPAAALSFARLGQTVQADLCAWQPCVEWRALETPQHPIMTSYCGSVCCCAVQPWIKHQSINLGAHCNM